MTHHTIKLGAWSCKKDSCKKDSATQVQRRNSIQVVHRLHRFSGQEGEFKCAEIFLHEPLVRKREQRDVRSCGSLLSSGRASVGTMDFFAQLASNLWGVPI